MKQLFKYEQPLHPEKDRDILVKRQNQVNEIINEILRGKFWAIYGPRKIGKTTLLNQVKHELSGPYRCIYVDCRNSPNSPQHFFQWFMNKVQEELGIKSPDLIDANQDRTDAPYENLTDFLQNLLIDKQEGDGP